MEKNKKIIICIVGVIVSAIIIVGLIVGINKLSEKKKIDEVSEELADIFKNDVITPEDDVYSKQKEADTKIKEAMNNEKYTLDSPYVVENPYYISPLTALVVFQTDSEETVTIEINGQKHEFEKSKKHAIPIYGLIAGKKNSVKISAGNKSKTLSLDMSSVKDDLNLNVEVGKGVNLGNDIYVVDTPSEEGMYGFNTNGELVWRINEMYNLSITVLDNGHLLLGNTGYIANYSRTGLIEIDYLGKIYNVYDIEGGYHDETVVLPSGNYLVLSSNITRSTVSDLIVEINPKNGEIVKTWDFKKIVNDISAKFVENIDFSDWASINSIYYDKSSDAILLSVSGRNSIVSIGYKSSKINWIFGDIKYWNDSFKNYIVSYDGTYPMVSNSISLNKNGNLVLFNNGMDGSLTEDSLCSNYIGTNSKGQIYKIENKKATLVSEFTDNNGFYSYAVSNYTELSSGNYLLFSAWEFGEGTMEAEGCTMNANVKGLHSLIYETNKDNSVLFKATFDVGSNRAAKVDMYDKTNKNFVVKDINYYNTLDSTIYEELKNENIVDKVKNAEKSVYSVSLSKNLLTINAVFQNDDEVYVLLVGKNNKSYKYLSKSKGNYLQPVVNLRGISGDYALFLVVNGVYYNLDQTYKF